MKIVNNDDLRTGPLSFSARIEEGTDSSIRIGVSTANVEVVTIPCPLNCFEHLINDTRLANTRRAFDKQVLPRLFNVGSHLSVMGRLDVGVWRKSYRLEYVGELLLVDHGAQIPMGD
ncbi:hypothetical protein WME99_04845 [Sorangium sp. So ce136]|uniref:hypothetical protein n=1 Tax=Sorangium sp. So ce136 TaxID=3133284 RepID=UPI003F021787